MLPKKNRADKKMVEKIFKKGFFIASGSIVLKYIRENNNNLPHISFIAPKGIAKKAVDRNRLRRVGYSIVKKYLHLFPVGFVGAFVFGKNSLILFSGRKNKTSNPRLNLENEIKSILKKARF